MLKQTLRVMPALVALGIVLSGCGASTSAPAATTAPAATAAATEAAATTAPAATAAATTEAPAAATTEAATTEATTEATTAEAATGELITVRVGASAVPHAEILNFIKENLAAKEGLNLEITEFDDYVLPNTALAEGQLDANFFQHVPYMETFAKEQNIPLVAVTKVHIEPLGIYSKKAKALADVADGATVAIPNDPTNGGRALQLLAANGLLTLKDGVTINATKDDIATNPKNLNITELAPAQLPRSLDDVDLAVINGNYAIQAGLTPSKDALALEAGQNNPYANVLATIQGKENDPGIQKLAKLLNSPEVKKFIEDKYQGSVVPAF